MTRDGDQPDQPDQHDQHDQHDHDQVEPLSPADQAALDELVEAGFDRDPSRAASERQRKILALLGLLRDYPVEDPDETLVHATLARVDRHEDNRTERMTTVPGRGRRRIWSPDFISVAAVFLIGFAVLWPVVHNVRQHALDDRCASNLRQIGNGFGQYAAAYAGAMPVAKAGGSWDQFANVINLGPLVAGGYCDSGHLGCPCVKARDFLDASYSYQWPTAGTAPRWGRGQAALLGDRNPLIDAFRAGGWAPALTVSPNHGGRGQNVLVGDGGTHWLETPVVGHDDNIWLPEGRDSLERGAQPGQDDSFLVH